MINAHTTAADALNVVDFVDPVVADKMAHGAMNVDDATICAHIQASIRRGHPQVRPQPVQPGRIILVGSGPSLNDTEDELRAMVWQNGKHDALVTLNGAYHWCRERGLRPQTQIVMDARPSNARFVTPEVPFCNYLLASQCAPAVWDAVASYPHVWLFHPVVKDEGQTSAILDEYYAGNWLGIGGGTTVVTRAIFLLRCMGYVRFELFGIDCCWQGNAHHALAQPENAHDRATVITVTVKGSDVPPRQFRCSGWHVKQIQDLMVTLKVNGAHYLVTSHGDGVLTYLLHALGTAGPDAVTLTPSPD